MKNRLKLLRAENNITQAKLAVKCGISRATINAIEREEVIPNLDTVLKLTRVLQREVKDIFLDFM